MSFLIYNNGRNFINIKHVEYVHIQKRKSEEVTYIVNEDFEEEEFKAEREIDVMYIKNELAGGFIEVDSEENSKDYLHNLSILKNN